MTGKTNLKEGLKSAVFRIDKRGVWFHEGQEIKRPSLVGLFARILEKDKSGKYWLKTPVEKEAVIVEDAPFIITDIVQDIDDPDKPPTIQCLTNLNEKVNISAEHPIRMIDDIPYIHIRNGLDAKVSRAVYLELVEIAITQSVARKKDKNKPKGFYSSNYFQLLE